MRSSICILWLAFGAVAVPGLAQDEPVADAPFEYVCLKESEPAFVNGMPVVVDEMWERRDDVPAGRAPARCWAWSASCPPRLVEPGQNAAADCRARGESSRPLAVRMQTSEAPDSHGDPVDGAPAAAEFKVTAAPAAMWRQVPRDLLPTTTVASGSFSLPRDDETWRVQARAEGVASIWRDVARKEGTVELALHDAVELTVQATAGDAPLAGARMYLVRSGSGRAAAPEPLGFGISDAGGKVDLTVSERERAAVLVSHVTRSASAFERFDDMPPVVELDPGLAVTGRTVDAEGRPMAGVRLLGLSWAGGELAAMQRHLGLSGSDGRFSLTGFTKGTASLGTDGGDLEYSQGLDLEGSLDLGSIVLRAPETYWIQVADASRGTPIPGARAVFGGGEGTTTDREGIGQVSPRFSRTLLISAKGYRPARFAFGGGGPTREEPPIPGLPTFPVDVAGDVGATAEEPLVLRLAPAFTVEGVFVAADGVTTAASGRLVASRPMAGGSRRMSPSTLAADGSFSLDLEPGAYTLELTAANAGRRVLEVSGSAGETRDLGVIVAPASAWVSGTVVNPEYAPVPEARISYLRPAEFGGLMARAMGQVAEVAADAEGYFEMHGLELGPSSLRVDAEGFAPLEFEVEAATIEWVDAGFVELSRGRRITVRSDVDGGIVHLAPGREHDPLGPMTGKLVDGEAVFEAVPEEPLRLRVMEDGVPVCERREDAGTGDEVMRCDRSTLTVTGGVTRAGQPGNGELLWSLKAENPQGGGVVTTLRGTMSRTQGFGGQMERTAPIDHEGRYRLESMLPGEWEVLFSTLEGGRQQEREVVVPDTPGEEVVLDFHYGGVSIDGIVVDSEGQPVTHATVDIFPGRRAVVTGRSGRYEIMDLAPGAYQLRARFRHSRSELIDVELRDYNDRRSVQLNLRDDASDDELVVRLAGGGGGGFCFVEMEGAGQRVVRIDGGVATTQLTPPLTDRVRVACQADGRWVLTGWQPLEPALDRGIELDPFESNSSIVLTGEPSPAAIQITGPGGWDLGKLRLWFGGATAFEIGETISNLPVGEYTLRWGNQVRTVWTERRRSAEVEIED